MVRCGDYRRGWPVLGFEWPESVRVGEPAVNSVRVPAVSWGVPRQTGTFAGGVNPFFDH